MKEAGFKGYLIKVLNGMAQGLFSSLIIGLIIKQIGIVLGIDILINFGEIAQKMMGPAIGAGVAYSIDAPILGILSAMAAGSIGAGTISVIDGMNTISIGEPVGAFIAAVIGAEASKIVSGRTKIDIILVPITTILLGGLTGHYIGPGIAKVMNYIGVFLNMATELHPIPMGIVISVTMGMLLTLPISSAAIAISLNLSGLAAGAATAGCAANMIGFAVSSFRENGFGGFIAQGLGTSMLQIPNIIKNPKIWLPAIISSAVVGPISSVLFKMEASSIGAGMGTSGLVGQIDMINTMGMSNDILGKIILLHIVIPGILSYFISERMRKKGYIKLGDMQL